jgi:hypothetical protein
MDILNVDWIRGHEEEFWLLVSQGWTATAVLVYVILILAPGFGGTNWGKHYNVSFLFEIYSNKSVVIEFFVWSQDDDQI